MTSHGAATPPPPDKEMGDLAKETDMALSDHSTREPSLAEKPVDQNNKNTAIEEGAVESTETALEKTTSKIETYPTGVKLALTLASIYLSVFLVALDRTIIATALPQITDKFQSFGDVGWVCSLTL
jgi:hypothetical protein